MDRIQINYDVIVSKFPIKFTSFTMDGGRYEVEIRARPDSMKPWVVIHRSTVYESSHWYVCKEPYESLEKLFLDNARLIGYLLNEFNRLKLKLQDK